MTQAVRTDHTRRRLRVEDASPLLAVLQILFHLLPVRLLGAGEDLQIEVHELLKVLHFAGFLDAMRCSVFGGRRRRSAGIQRLFRLRSRLALDAAQLDAGLVVLIASCVPQE